MHHPPFGNRRGVDLPHGVRKIKKQYYNNIIIIHLLFNSLILLFLI
jgi:hypothetical protein